MSIDVRAQIRTVRKRWPILVLAVAASVGGTFFWTYRQPRIFEASCSVIIDSMAPQYLQGIKDVVEMGTGSYWGNREFYETQYRIMTSKDIALRAVDKLGLVNDIDYPVPNAAQVKNRTPEMLAGMVAGQTKIVPVKESRIANIVVRDRLPQRAALIANAMADAYIEKNLEYKMEGSRTAQDWFLDQAGDLAAKLKKSETELFEFRQRKQLLDVSLDDKQSMTSENMRTYNQKLADVRARIIDLESNRKFILAAQNNIEEQESLPEIRNNTIVQALKTMHFDLLRKKAELETTYGEKHPAMERLKQQVLTVNRDYVAEIRKVLKSLDTQYLALRESEKSLASVMEKEKRQALEIAKVDVEYRPLFREAENNQKLYQTVTQRQKETGLSGLIRSNNVRTLERAVRNDAQVSPRLMFNLSMALGLGLTLGIGLAFLIEALDNTLKSQEQVEAILGVPVLGIVPIIGDLGDRKLTPEELRDRDMGVFRDPKSSAAESCRSIRTNLMFLSPERPLRSMVVTSPGPQEGKTTTAISLAISTAMAGTRVILVDTDLRRPRVHRSFGMPNVTGVSNLIVGETTLDEAVRHTEVPNLDVLTCGPTPPNPAELLHTDRFKNLIRDLTARYDRVIFDSPPISLVTDPAVIANLTDGVVLVVRGGVTTRDAAAYARRQLGDAKAHILGAIINHVDLSDKGYYYHYARYYRGYSKYGRYYAEESGKA